MRVLDADWPALAQAAGAGAGPPPALQLLERAKLQHSLVSSAHACMAGGSATGALSYTASDLPTT